MTPPRTVRPRLTERALVEQAARHLEERGFRTYVDPDGTDYFDLVARRGPEVGLVEGKLGRPRALLGQALRRRPWGDWVAVALPSRRLAERLVAETRGRRSEPVGVWLVQENAVVELRAAVPFTARPDPYAPERARLHRVLDQVDRGEIPTGARWDGVAREVRRASGGRGFAEWRLDEGP